MKHVKLVASYLLLIMLSLAACQATQPTAAPTAPPAGPVLELQGPAGSRSLTLDDLRALPAVEGWAGLKSSTGRIVVPERYKGVALDELCRLVGGLTPDTGVNAVAKDGYAMTISYQQIADGDFITYDPGTGDELKVDDPLTVILAYERGGQAIPEEDGPLRLVVVTPKNNQVVDGHWSVKWINQVQIKSLAEDWTLELLGAISEEMDRGTFQSCSAPACHGATWKDEKAQVWSGVPLWLLAARVDDDNRHGDEAFNKSLAEKGYQVELVAADGYTISFDIASLKQNNAVILAYLVNDNPLGDEYFPLRLVGVDLSKKEMIGQVDKIRVVLDGK
ncbi:MAG: molybdopterin-dependent oxidoreductase [Thermoflexales bacterium]|nr:molybdopterin-dependent oxidoreductase [Thermoflexales bacterium]